MSCKFAVKRKFKKGKHNINRSELKCVKFKLEICTN